MSKFVLTAQLQLQAPNNVGAVVKQIQSQLKSVTVSVKAKNAAQATKQVQGLSKALTQADKASYKLGKTFTSSLKRFAAFSVATRAVSLLTQGLGGAIAEAISFERELMKVAQVTGRTLGQLKGLTDEITRLSTTLGVSSKELLGVTRALSQAGFSAFEAKVALDALAKSSLAPTFENMGKTAEGAIAIFNQFGKGAEALEGQLGAINAVAGRFAVEAGDLISAVRRTGGVFKAAGGNLNELIALFTSVRSTTRESAESIATGLRTIFTRIQRPRTIKFLKEMGVNLVDLEGKFVGPYEAIRRLSEAMKNMEAGDLRFVKVAEQLGGFRQIGKVIPLIQQFAVSQEALNVAMGGTSSLADDASKAQGALAVKVQKLKEEWLALIRGFSDSTGFKIMINSALGLATAIVKMLDALKDVLPIMMAIAGVKMFRGMGGFMAGAKSGMVSSVPKMASGGMVPGSGSGDTVPAMLTPGEFVIRKSSVKKMGADNLNSMNTRGYASGGTVKLKENKIGGFFLIPEKGASDKAFKYKPSKLKTVTNPHAVADFTTGAGTGSWAGAGKDGENSDPYSWGGGKSAETFGEAGAAEAFSSLPRKKQDSILERHGITHSQTNTGSKIKLNQLSSSLPSKMVGELATEVKPTSLQVDATAPKMRAFFLGQGNKKTSGKVAEAVTRQTVKGLKSIVNGLMKDEADIKALSKGKGALDVDEKKVKKALNSLYDKDEEGGAVQSIEGFANEGLIGSLTGAIVGGGGTGFDFPNLNTQADAKTRLKALYGEDGVNALLHADAKRSLKGSNEKIFQKAFKSLEKGQNASDYKAMWDFSPNKVRKKASGGPAGTDTVPALLTPGEFVVNAKSARSIGQANLNRMNKRGVAGFAAGGPVQRFAGGGGAQQVGMGGMGILMALPMIQAGFEKIAGESETMSDAFLGITTGVTSFMGVMIPMQMIMSRWGSSAKDAADETDELAAAAAAAADAAEADIQAATINITATSVVISGGGGGGGAEGKDIAAIKILQSAQKDGDKKIVSAIDPIDDEIKNLDLGGGGDSKKGAPVEERGMIVSDTDKVKPSKGGGKAEAAVQTMAVKVDKMAVIANSVQLMVKGAPKEDRAEPPKALPAPEVLKGLPAPEVLKGLPAPEVLKGLPAPEVLKGLPAPEVLKGLPAPDTKKADAEKEEKKLRGIEQARVGSAQNKEFAAMDRGKVAQDALDQADTALATAQTPAQMKAAMPGTKTQDEELMALGKQAGAAAHFGGKVDERMAKKEGKLAEADEAMQKGLNDESKGSRGIKAGKKMQDEGMADLERLQKEEKAIATRPGVKTTGAPGSEEFKKTKAAGEVFEAQRTKELEQNTAATQASEKKVSQGMQQEEAGRTTLHAGQQQKFDALTQQETLTAGVGRDKQKKAQYDQELSTAQEGIEANMGARRAVMQEKVVQESQVEAGHMLAKEGHADAALQRRAAAGDQESQRAIAKKAALKGEEGILPSQKPITAGPGPAAGAEADVAAAVPEKKAVTHYDTLGVDPSASPEEIQKAYRKQARKVHPDVKGGSKEAFQQLGSAKDVLADPARRAKYDKDLAAKADAAVPSKDVPPTGPPTGPPKPPVLGLPAPPAPPEDEPPKRRPPASAQDRQRLDQDTRGAGAKIADAMDKIAVQIDKKVRGKIKKMEETFAQGAKNLKKKWKDAGGAVGVGGRMMKGSWKMTKNVMIKGAQLVKQGWKKAADAVKSGAKMVKKAWSKVKGALAKMGASKAGIAKLGAAGVAAAKGAIDGMKAVMDKTWQKALKAGSLDLADVDAGATGSDVSGTEQMIRSKLQMDMMASKAGGAASGMMAGGMLGPVGAIAGGIIGAFGEEITAGLGSMFSGGSFAEGVADVTVKKRQNLEAEIGQKQLMDFSTDFGDMMKDIKESKGSAESLEAVTKGFKTAATAITAIEKVDPEAAKRATKDLDKRAVSAAEAIGSSVRSQAELDERIQALTSAYGNNIEAVKNAAKSAFIAAEALRAVADLKADVLVVSSIFGAAGVAVSNFTSSLVTGANTMTATVNTLKEAQKNIAMGRGGTAAVEKARKEVMERSGISADSEAGKAINRQFDTLGQAADVTARLPSFLKDTKISKGDNPIQVRDQLTEGLVDAMGIDQDSQMGKVIAGQIGKLTDDQIRDIQEEKLDLSTALASLGPEIAKLGEGALKAAEALQKHEATMIKMTQQRIKMEGNLLKAQQKAVDLQIEAAKIAAKHGGKQVTAAQKRQAVVDKANLQAGQAGVRGLAGTSGGDIRSMSARITQASGMQSFRAQLPGAFGGTKGLDADKRKDLAAAQQALIKTTKELIAIEKEELKITKEKNRLERQSLESLLGGDVEGYFKQQGAMGATAAVASGSQTLMSMFGADEMAGAFKNVQQMEKAGVGQVGGMDINTLVGRTGAAALGARGIDDPRAAAVLTGQTAEEQDSNRRIRDLAGGLGAIGEGAAQMMEMEVNTANINISNANVKFKTELGRAAEQFVRGGPVYANAGLFIPKGTDRIPAMLTPGEFVINRASVNRGNNLQILRAINSGTSAGVAQAMSGGGQAGYYAGGGAVGGALSSDLINKLSDSLRSFNANLKENIDRLQKTKFQIKLDNTNVTVNLKSGGFLRKLKKQVKDELLAEVGDQIKNLKFNDAGEASTDNNVL
jgi:hypothetical protein